MFDIQMIVALQTSRRVIEKLLDEPRPTLEVPRTAGEPKMKALRFGFWKLPKFKRVKVQTRATIR